MVYAVLFYSNFLPSQFSSDLLFYLILFYTDQLFNIIFTFSHFYAGLVESTGLFYSVLYFILLISTLICFILLISDSFYFTHFCSSVLHLCFILI